MAQAHRVIPFWQHRFQRTALQGVGTGIAMGNAHPRLKEVADRVAEAIHHDGLAKMVAQLQMEFAQ